MKKISIYIPDEYAEVVSITAIGNTGETVNIINHVERIENGSVIEVGKEVSND